MGVDARQFRKKQVGNGGQMIVPATPVQPTNNAQQQVTNANLPV
jgi:hypothetical protein